jgi:hypothetical protein
MMLSTITLITSIGMNSWNLAAANINPMLGPSPQVLLRMGALSAPHVVEQG